MLGGNVKPYKRTPKTTKKEAKEDEKDRELTNSINIDSGAINCNADNYLPIQTKKGVKKPFNAPKLESMDERLKYFINFKF